MKLSVFLMLVTTALAVAAPVRQRTPNNFGIAVETKGVTCELPQTGELRVRVSKEAALETIAHEVARPLFTRTVDGEFELTPRITHTPTVAKDLTVMAGASRSRRPGSPSTSRTPSGGRWSC